MYPAESELAAEHNFCNLDFHFLFNFHCQWSQGQRMFQNQIESSSCQSKWWALGPWIIH